MRVLVCLPTYDEREALPGVVADVLANVAADVLVVDDASPDGTGDLADALSASHSRVAVLHRPKKEGLGPAYLAGFRWALAEDYDVIVQMDADGSHAAADLAGMLGRLAEADVVVGSRRVEGGRFDGARSRRLLSAAGSWLSRQVLGGRIADWTGGFNVWRREVLEAIDLDTVQARHFVLQVELKHRAVARGFRVVEYPIVFGPRETGRSKLGAEVLVEGLIGLWRMRP